MFEPSTSTIPSDSQLSKRSDSFSTLSSSLAVADIKNQYSNLTQNLNNNLASNNLIDIKPNSSNVQFENSDGIHVGDLVYHIHHHSSEADPNESPRNSTNSSTTDDMKERKGVIRKIMSRRGVWLVPVILSIVSIIIGVSVVVYYLLANNQNNNEATTTEFITTDETTIETTSTTPGIVLPKYFVTRENWGADPPKSNLIPMLKSPIKRIIIGHTRGSSCINEVDCISAVKSIQSQDPNLDDIAYNFLIGRDERVYEGRGFDYQGQHTQNSEATEYNSIGICIAFIGDYSTVAPYLGLINLLKSFISTFVERGVIATDHIIVLQDDLKYFEPKANALNAVIATIDNFRPLHKIYRREEWVAQNRRGTPEKFSRTMDWVLIGHTVTPLCNDLNACMARARSLQAYDFTKNPPLDDIAYNIFFGGDGFAFEGVGWDYFGTHSKGFNDKTIGVGVIGEFTSVPPNQKVINAIVQVFDDAMALGKLTDDYKIFGRKDFAGPGPGDAFMTLIREWCRYGNRTTPC
ncbi:peptidoglycan recognition protein 3-like [Chironomus tepperi]|uniref:peptidoglycan recognition protein 3-like n=1 Tax=Chironomus tepperi TaxID=113505 RepID=UPI00391F2610